MHHILINENYLTKKKIPKRLDRALKTFDEAKLKYEIHKTTDKEHLRKITSSLTLGEGNTVIVAGGDGALHDVLNGFENFKGNAIGLIPLGTGNDFAAAAGIPLNPEKAAKIIIKNNARPIDFIELGCGLRVLNTIGMGIDVDVLKRAYSGKNTKKSKYLKALIVSLAKFKSYDFTVKYEGKEETHFGLIATVGNGRQIGGGIKIFPEADIEDGKLNLMLCDYFSKFGTVRAFIKLMLGKINSIKQVTALTTNSVTFIPHGEHYTVQADGELYDDIPLEIHISNEKLNFCLN